MSIVTKAKELQSAQKELQDKIKQLLQQQSQNQKSSGQQQSQQPQGQGQQQPGNGQGQQGPQGSGQGQNQGQGQGQGQPQSGQGAGGNRRENLPHVIDNHEVWHDNGQSQEDTRMAVQNALSQAMDETIRQYGEGSVPASIRNMINESLKPPKVDWRKVLTNYIGRKISFERSSTRKRPNRRLGLIAPGKTAKQGPKTLFAVDCSGSVADEEYLEIMAEIKEALKNFPEKCEMIFFDWTVFKEKIKLNSMKKIPSRPLQGGTSFQPVMDYARESKPDLLIVLTDGEAPTPTKPGCPVLWVIIGGRDNPELFGKRIVVDKKDLKKVSKMAGSNKI
jgi:predicted metal-dependent peptidase